MFKQLKTKLLTLNILTIMILIIVSFTSIYILTLKKTNEDTHNILLQISNSKPKPFAIDPPPFDEKLPKRLISFVLNYDDNHNITSRSSFFDEDYRNLFHPITNE